MKKAALITGASSGIGAATAIEFSKNDYFVYLMGRDKDRLQETALQCRHGATLLSCDLQNTAALDKRLQEMMNIKIHQVEALVNNAGIFERNNFVSTSDESWQQQFAVNLLAPVHITRTLFPMFIENGGGSIVNVSSTLGMKPTSGVSAYSAAKAAMINWTQSLALEGGPHKIRANCVCPGIVETPIHKGTDLSKLGHLQPLGRVGTPAEIARSIYFLGSDQSSWTTGSILAVDGGIQIA